MSQNVLEAISAMAGQERWRSDLGLGSKEVVGQKMHMTDSVRKETAHDTFSR